MNNLTIKKLLGHLVTVVKHRHYVKWECYKRGMFWQGAMHDLSKFHPVEFITSARYYTGYKSPIGLEKADNGYSMAWLHHKAANKHHWEYWTDFKEGKILRCPVPEKYVREMACDMIGASKAYLGKKHCKTDPLEYFKKHEYRFLMHQEAKNLLEQLLKQYAEN